METCQAFHKPVDRVKRKRAVGEHRTAVPWPGGRDQRVVGIQLTRLQPPGQHVLLGNIVAQDHRETVGASLDAGGKRVRHIILARFAAASWRTASESSRWPLRRRRRRAYRSSCLNARPLRPRTCACGDGMARVAPRSAGIVTARSERSESRLRPRIGVAHLRCLEEPPPVSGRR